MNRNALKYQAYQALLESSIPSHTKQKLIEAGFLQKVAAFFGAGGETAKELTAGVRKIFADKKLGRRSAVAKTNIEKELEELKAIAKTAGVSEESVYDILHLILKEKGMNPASVADSPTGGGGAPQAGGAQPGVQPAVITVQSLTQNPQVAAPLVAAVTGKDVQAVAGQLESKPPSAAKITDLVAKAAAKETGIKPEIVSKAIQALIKAGELKLESKKRRSTNVIAEQSGLIFERWQQLAGVRSGLLVERDADVGAFNDLMKAIEDGTIESAEELKAYLQGEKGKAAGLSKAMKKQLTAAFQKKNPKEDKKEVEQAVEAAPTAPDGGDAASPSGGGADAAPAGGGDDAKLKELEAQLGVKDSEVQKHRDEADKLAKELESNKNIQSLFKKHLAQALKIDPSEFEKTLRQVGFEGMIAAAMAKNPSSVEAAADKAGVEVPAAGTPAAGEAAPAESKMTKVIRSEIKAEELDDASLTKLVNYIETLMDKAKAQSDQLQQAG